MNGFGLFNSTEITDEMMTSFGSALNKIPSLRQVALLLSVSFYLVVILLIHSVNILFEKSFASPVARLIIERMNETTALKFSGPADLLQQFTKYFDHLLSWVGLSPECQEALICRAGASMASDFPAISSKISASVSTLLGSSHEPIGLTKMLLDVMVGQGDCLKSNTHCSAIKKFENLDGVHEDVAEMGHFFDTIFKQAVSKIALIYSSTVVAILTSFIAWFLFIVLNRKPRKSSRIMSNILLHKKSVF